MAECAIDVVENPPPQWCILNDPTKSEKEIEEWKIEFNICSNCLRTIQEGRGMACSNYGEICRCKSPSYPPEQREPNEIIAHVENGSTLYLIAAKIEEDEEDEGNSDKYSISKDRHNEGKNELCEVEFNNK